MLSTLRGPLSRSSVENVLVTQHRLLSQDASCPICFEPLSSSETVVTPTRGGPFSGCGHLFCFGCLESVLSNGPSVQIIEESDAQDLCAAPCPICRHPFIHIRPITLNAVINAILNLDMIMDNGPNPGHEFVLPYHDWSLPSGHDVISVAVSVPAIDFVPPSVHVDLHAVAQIGNHTMELDSPLSSDVDLGYSSDGSSAIVINPPYIPPRPATPCPSRYACNTCDRHFATSLGLRSHERVHGRYGCSSCRRRFGCRRTRDLHVRNCSS